MNTHHHLTEAERQDAAEASTPPEQQARVDDHLRQCESCASDVARVRQLMTHVREAPPPVDAGSDLWPEIRSRIERDKVISLSIPEPAAADRTRWWARALWLAGALAAALILVVALPASRGKGKASAPAIAPSANSDVMLAADTARAYEREAQYLLNELEMRRAMMPPRTATSIDRDLQIIDRAIAELKDAIARDPNNPALRRLLASSYKQKVELLKRATNPG